MVGAVVGGISTGIGIINSLGLGSVDPQKEAERLATIDILKRDAIASRSKTSRAYVHLACWAGASKSSHEHALAVEFGMVEPNQECRVGSDSALVYAKAAKLAVDAALLVSGTVAPLITNVAVDHVVQQAKSALPFVLLALAVVGLFVFMRKGGK